MSFIILDFEGYRGVDNQVIIKELSALDSINNRVKCLTFKPSPCDQWKNLNDSVRKTNTYILNNIHGIPYNYGDCEYKDLERILSDITNRYCVLFSKGDEKCKILSNICGKYIVNITDICSSTCSDEGFNTKNIVSCFNQHKPKYVNTHCSLKKVYYYEYLLKNHVDKNTMKRVMHGKHIT